MESRGVFCTWTSGTERRERAREIGFEEQEAGEGLGSELGVPPHSEEWLLPSLPSHSWRRALCQALPAHRQPARTRYPP